MSRRLHSTERGTKLGYGCCRVKVLCGAEDTVVIRCTSLREVTLSVLRDETGTRLSGVKGSCVEPKVLRQSEEEVSSGNREQGFPGRHITSFKDFQVIRS